MSKTRQVMHFCDYGKEYRVIKHYGKENPYRIYQDISVFENGIHKGKRVLKEKYADLQSCFYWFLQNNIGC